LQIKFAKEDGKKERTADFHKLAVLNYDFTTIFEFGKFNVEVTAMSASPAKTCKNMKSPLVYFPFWVQSYKLYFIIMSILLTI